MNKRLSGTINVSVAYNFAARSNSMTPQWCGSQTRFAPAAEFCALQYKDLSVIERQFNQRTRSGTNKTCIDPDSYELLHTGMHYMLGFLMRAKLQTLIVLSYIYIKMKCKNLFGISTFISLSFENIERAFTGLF